MRDDSFEQFAKKWNKIIEYVNKAQDGLDERGAEQIRLNFREDVLLLIIDSKRMGIKFRQRDVSLIESELEAALNIAESRYKLKNEKLKLEERKSIMQLLKEVLGFIRDVLRK
ncbi:hypothetical protein [Geoglobus ahangari]|uniref:hypothetical protein n=1 Tax=Geoglobus ahangari TaxID=113653 RepID=UPI00064EA2A9|nr:hypothetical protein [Geoglobus ahangari]